MVNHARKIFGLFKPAAEWFNDHVRGSGLSGLCMTGYTTISTGMQGAFVERWHKETSSFHLPVGEMLGRDALDRGVVLQGGPDAVAVMEAIVTDAGRAAGYRRQRRAQGERVRHTQ